ncbi:MAG: cytochrome P450 [Pseudophaeobacter sp. bin_em_oilr2.035]|uniref:Cytochrome P450 n=1 Tax=Phaeobacter gallaeciensis TaxID=60890 RepID=A0ABD4X4V9_9RHOB|nr:cytochrome P450 [Phaeobacter gallaeciensis]MDF1772778.1 cytochrome P450 [Pseudophaeobacter sp. bin_em_oilr2.035]MDE4143399.1 cytochrome P450 [Phaeobacter gallaeciensis]MDE4156239.1 cytochrome P450 [Phaeobacter gallaeciensis]MDE4160427.1 cytochrome P450 [Phaeobacter gallaeciensis]MDE4164479.1 cytochrome P450 [Phaeobacter gallaeciensis]
MTPLPPKPPARPDKVSLWRYVKLFRKDILSAQPARLYRAWMAEFRTPFFRSFLLNQPDLVKTVLKDRPDDFPKSDRISEGLKPLLGNSVFLTNGEAWKRQRRIIDPAFEGGRLKETFPAMRAAAEAAAARLKGQEGEVEIEAVTSHLAADVIFRTLFSIPIEHEVAAEVFSRFRDYQRSQPILNLAAFVPVPRWMPRFFRKETRENATRIRALITQLTDERAAEIAAGTAPQDLATKIMTTADPETGARFLTEEMVDQVAIFFLAGHETSASALAWTLYLMAIYPEWQERVAEEAAALEDDSFAAVSRLRISRDVFREALRLYPPVPMMVREATCPERFRDREVPKGSQLVLSPWHLHRHERLWDNPDGFDPERWQTENGKKCQREAYMPFSAGPRVCTGAGFAMVEGPLILSMLLRHFRVAPVAGKEPVPVAHLTVRAKNGIWLRLERRDQSPV